MSTPIIVGRSNTIKTYTQEHNVVAPKDEVATQLIPQQISECSLTAAKSGCTTCVGDDMVKLLAQSLNITSTNPDVVMNQAKQELGCSTQKCVLSKMTPSLGAARVQQEVLANLKLPGPTGVALLSNVNIDATLRQWSTKFKDFYPHSFNMLNYMEYSYRRGSIIRQPDSLQTIDFAHLYSGTERQAPGVYRCTACVINSDVYQGGGKHWMALFADARDPQVWTVEFFNSSGNAPAPEWIAWMGKTRDEMQSLAATMKPPPEIRLVRASSIRHQQSTTECGLYSLYYIWARLNGKPVGYFAQHIVPDQWMFELRQHLFDSGSVDGGAFDWSEFLQKHPVRWE